MIGWRPVGALRVLLQGSRLSRVDLNLLDHKIRQTPEQGERAGPSAPGPGWLDAHLVLVAFAEHTGHVKQNVP